MSVLRSIGANMDSSSQNGEIGDCINDYRVYMSTFTIENACTHRSDHPESELNHFSGNTYIIL